MVRLKRFFRCALEWGPAASLTTGQVLWVHPPSRMGLTMTIAHEALGSVRVHYGTNVGACRYRIGSHRLTNGTGPSNKDE